MNGRRALRADQSSRILCAPSAARAARRRRLLSPACGRPGPSPTKKLHIRFCVYFRFIARTFGSGAGIEVRCPFCSVHSGLAVNQIVPMIHFGFATGIPKVMRLHGVWIDARPEPAKVCVGKDAGTASHPLGSTVKLETVPAFFRFGFVRLM